MKPLLDIKHLPTRSLTIDDEKDICVLLSYILKKRNIENICAHDLQESISLLGEHSFDLIFLDNYLPDGEGINFISYLKSYFPEVKIIFITAMMDEHIQFHIGFYFQLKHS